MPFLTVKNKSCRHFRAAYPVCVSIIVVSGLNHTSMSLRVAMQTLKKKWQSNHKENRPQFPKQLIESEQYDLLFNTLQILNTSHQLQTNVNPKGWFAAHSSICDIVQHRHCRNIRTSFQSFFFLFIGILISCSALLVTNTTGNDYSLLLALYNQ